MNDDIEPIDVSDDPTLTPPHLFSVGRRGATAKAYAVADYLAVYCDQLELDDVERAAIHEQAELHGYPLLCEHGEDVLYFLPAA